MKPLSGVRVVELAGLGPAPFAAMLLAEHGAEVTRVTRPGGAADDPLAAGRRTTEVDLKSPDGSAHVLELVGEADVLLEGFRPGTTERLGLGPDVCLARNPRLVYGRMTGWGQDGPRAHDAGHDINYIALAGALAHIGRADAPPTPPLNLVGDMGGGAVMAFGLLAGVLHSRATGHGCLVDTSMLESTLMFMTPFRTWQESGHYADGSRGSNLLDSGAPYYDVYECADGRYVAVGAIEDAFFARLATALGLSERYNLPADVLTCRTEPRVWPTLRAALADAFRTRSRDEWGEHLAGGDACVTPVLDMSEVAADPHVASLGSVARDGRAMPTPRFREALPADQSPVPDSP